VTKKSSPGDASARDEKKRLIIFFKRLRFLIAIFFIPPSFAHPPSRLHHHRYGETQTSPPGRASALLSGSLNQASCFNFEFAVPSNNQVLKSLKLLAFFNSQNNNAQSVTFDLC
jgi:hypothetical protein